MTRGLGGHSPSNVSQYLKGMDFPADKEDIVECAQQNGADNDVLETIKALPDGEYNTMADVMKGYGQENKSSQQRH